MNKTNVNIAALYRAIRDLEDAIGEVINSGVDDQFEMELVNGIDRVIEVLDIYIEQKEEEIA